MSLSFILSLLAILSCSKKNNGGNDSVVPSNLNVSAVVSTDNSGNVAFTATATNAVSYDYDYGNGVYATIAAGSVTYKYPASNTYTVNVTAKSSTGQTITKSIQVMVTVAMSLVWSDEFNTAGAPDASKWGYDIGAGGWGNNELQYYTNRTDNAVVSNGTLKITARKEAFSGSNYTSARLLTKNKFTTKYGKVEARMKLPAGVGTWPAFWMLGANLETAPWPACGEIDIMEHKGSDEGRIYATLHHPGHSGGNGDGGTRMFQNVTTDFHVYAVEWTAANLKFSVDGTVFYTFNNSASLPFNNPFFIIFNFALGGTFGGPLDPAFNSAVMEVDYVRVYN